MRCGRKSPCSGIDCVARTETRRDSTSQGLQSELLGARQRLEVLQRKLLGVQQNGQQGGAACSKQVQDPMLA